MCARSQTKEQESENLLRESGIQRDVEERLPIRANSWQKSDWRKFYESARRPWRRLRPPRPVYPAGVHRVQPATGFSLSELDGAGMDLDLAESLGIPVDAGRVGSYGPNIFALRGYLVASRRPA